VTQGRLPRSAVTFGPGPTPNTVRAADGTILSPPDGWALLPSSDAALTRRGKEPGEHWVVQEKKIQKTFSRGVWAPAATIDRIRAELEAERATASYAKRKEAGRHRTSICTRFSGSGSGCCNARGPVVTRSASSGHRVATPWPARQRNSSTVSGRDNSASQM
jgi:hypothetical protein